MTGEEEVIQLEGDSLPLIHSPLTLNSLSMETYIPEGTFRESLEGGNDGPESTATEKYSRAKSLLADKYCCVGAPDLLKSVPKCQSHDETCRHDLELLADQIIAAGKPWTDPDFPPESRSIVDPANDARNDRIKNF